MIVLKTQSELKTMMKAMRISAETLNIAEETIREGITTKELDKAMYDFIIRSGAKPSFLGLYGFPATACISVNDVVIHGIPDKHPPEIRRYCERRCRCLLRRLPRRQRLYLYRRRYLRGEQKAASGNRSGPLQGN